MVVHTAHVEGPYSHEPPSVKKDSRRPGGGRLAAEVLSAADGLQTGGWTGHRSADGVGEFADAAALAKLGRRWLTSPTSRLTSHRKVERWMRGGSVFFR